MVNRKSVVIKVSDNKEVYHDSQIVYLWEQNHEKDLLEPVNWRSWESLDSYRKLRGDSKK
jgi:hypothetical protein